MLGCIPFARCVPKLSFDDVVDYMMNMGCCEGLTNGSISFEPLSKFTLWPSVLFVMIEVLLHKLNQRKI